jgi:GAF domain-containing protein/HAMP domain-containing protein
MDSKAPGNVGLNLNLQAKLALGFSVMAIISSGIVAGAIYFRVRERLRDDIRNYLRDAVSIGSLYVNGDSHATLTDPAQMESDSYLSLKRDFQQIRDAGTDYRFVYSLREVGDDIQFIVDAEESEEDVSYLGDIYGDLPQEVAELIPVLEEPYVYDEFYEDEWGIWLTGYAPIRKSDGTVDAVLAIDIPANSVIAYQNSMLWSTLLIYLITMPVVAVVGWLLGRQLANPILSLIDGARRIEAGDFNYRAEVKTQDEVAQLADAFNSMGAQLGELVSGLERKVAERTQDVEQRSSYLRAAAEVSREATTILEADRLIPRVVELIRERFNLYYVGLFLVDDNYEWAVLRAGTGEAGKLLVERGHRIKIGEGMIGWCIQHTQARVALEAEQDAVRLVSPLLSATRSEAAIPLRSRGRVFGALTVQSDQPGVFDAETITVLQTMADQVSVALDNARLFNESEQALEALRRSIGEYRRQAWQETIRARSVIGYRGDLRGLRPISDFEPVVNHDLEMQSDDSDATHVQIPIIIRDQVLGMIEARKPQAAGEWSQAEIMLMNGLIDQLGVALENARHFEESQRRAEREKILADITGRVRSTADFNEIMQTAIKELSEALHVPRGSIRLIRSASQNPELISKPEEGDSGNGGSLNG